MGGAPVPGPQPALVPLVHGRRTQGQAAAGRGRPRRAAAARRHHRERRDARRADQRRVGRHARACPPPRCWRCTSSPSSAAARPALPPRCTAPPKGSRPCSSRAPRRAARPGAVRGSRTTSASPTGISGCRAHHVGPQAGRAVRRRGHHHPQGDRTRRQRPGPHDRVRRRQHHRRPGRDPGHRRRLPPTAGARLLGQPGLTGRLQLHRPRRLLRSLGVGRHGMRRRGRLHRRRRQLGGQAAMYMSREAKSVTLLVRGPSLAESMSYYLIQQIEGQRQHPRPDLHRGRRGPRRGRPPDRSATGEQADRRAGDRHSLADVLSSSAPLPRTDWLDGVVARDDLGFILTGPGSEGRLRLDAG